MKQFSAADIVRYEAHLANKAERQLATHISDQCAIS